MGALASPYNLPKGVDAQNDSEKASLRQSSETGPASETFRMAIGRWPNISLQEGNGEFVGGFRA